MEEVKTLRFEIWDNGDMSVTASSFEQAMELIQAELDEHHLDEKELYQYTINPKWMTDKEWLALPEQF